MTPRARTVVAAGMMAAILAVGAAGLAAAQGPFGVGHQSGFGGAGAASSYGGLVGWAFVKQAEFYRSLSGMIRAAKADGHAVWALFGVSFVYGIFHAIGPGHGKAVISSYLVANEETWRRGVVLSFASAVMQAIVAIAIVAVAAVLLNATAKMMGDTVRVIEIASYALVAVVGARLLWVKGRVFLFELHALHRPKSAGAAATPVPAHAHGHDHAHGRHVHGYAHDDHYHAACGHDHASAWGHAHGPEPIELAGPGGWRRGLSAIVAVGLRPCSGAIIVLVFALAQGLFWAGVGATFMMGLGTAITVAAIASLAVGARALAKRMANTRAGLGMLAMRGLETGAAALVCVFGVLLLTGYMASERLMGF